MCETLSPIPSAVTPSTLPSEGWTASAELEAASQVQQKLFPKQMPAAAGWEFAGLCRPARLLAGDYYDVFELLPGRIAFALGDVAGKGLGSSLVMACLHAIIRSRLAPSVADLPGFVREVNQYLLAALPEEMFVTLFLGVLDEATGRLLYVNAGHPPPLLLPSVGALPVRLAQRNSLLGVLPGAPYEAGELDLPPGSLLVLFSDGVTDARNGKGERFLERGLLEVLRASPARSASAVLAEIVAAVEQFALWSELQDDMALLVIRRQGGE